MTAATANDSFAEVRAEVARLLAVYGDTECGNCDTRCPGPYCSTFCEDMATAAEPVSG